MAKNRQNLRKALDRFQGRDYKLERQRKQEKEAVKKRESKQASKLLDAQPEANDDESGEEQGQEKIKNVLAALARHRGADLPEDASLNLDDDDIASRATFDMSMLDDSDSESDGDDESQDHTELRSPAAHKQIPEEDIALSDLSDGSADDADIIPHQRLTINNTTALRNSLSTFAIDARSIPFSEHQSITTATPVHIADVDDDLGRELAFYAQCATAVKDAKSRLIAEGVAFSRPADYFAEMVKSDEHMGKIKAKLIDDAASKKASADAKHQRDLKKFGKQVQNEKLKERAQAKRDMLEKVNLLKRKRQGAEIVNAEEEDMFDVALEDATVTTKRDKQDRKHRPIASTKRQKRDQKYGFGGKKRHAKSGDAISSGDMSGYSVRKMKTAGRATSKRPGKSKRASNR